MQARFIGEAELWKTENPDSSLSLTPGHIYTVLGIEADHFRVLHDDLRTNDNKPTYQHGWARPDLRSEDEIKRRPYPEKYAPAPVLYSPELFEVVDSSEPDFWICKFGEDGERYCYPKEWFYVGFFEDYFDRLPEAHVIFWDIYDKLYSES
jgi:hypothetical protein